ncbi:hypothetical protein OTC26_018685 [Streptomyces tirandamycinicus]|uniref:hypothetical protein n=1 Tax=Streptomyces tirandamycinicus TaxID=2174846 RepID=UPI00226DD0E7|nr:hypothetical protein [Streptomyces tirandamycinicus]MCY0982701.1 hypothetical protein [Streptomyces tirandamycinicus]
MRPHRSHRAAVTTLVPAATTATATTATATTATATAATAADAEAGVRTVPGRSERT